MVRNSSVPKMEPTFYDEPNFATRDLNTLKRTMTLDLNNRGAKKIKLVENQSPAILSSPDLIMLKLASPELEKMIIDQQNGMVTTTPTPTTIFFPSRNVTEEQESYARGFMDALNELHNSDSSQGGNQQDTSRSTYASLDSQYPTNYGFGMSPDNSVIIKDEPQTVPNLNSPPMSPIDMESQERIKLERKRQRNRVAASKCRRRKLERIALLEEKVKVLKGENAELSQVVNRLKEQVYHLKQQVMEHAKSGCHISVTVASSAV